MVYADNPDDKFVPFPVIMATILMWLHAAMVFLNAKAWAEGFNTQIFLYPAYFWTTVSIFIGIGLMLLLRWVWWIAVIGGVFSALNCLLTIVGGGFLESRGIIQGGGYNMIIQMLNGAFLLGSVFFLVRPASRAAFGFGKETRSSSARDMNVPPIPPPGRWSN